MNDETEDAEQEAASRSALKMCCLMTQISLVRNVEGIPIPSRLRSNKARETARLLTDRLARLVPVEDVTDDEALAAAGHIRYGIAPREDRSPNYRLLRARLKHGTVIWCELMSANHYTFSVSGSFTDFAHEAEILRRFVNMLARPLHFAYDPAFGYLTTQLTLTGNGLRIRSWMHLPGLSHFGLLNELSNAAEMYGALAELEQPDNPPPGHIIILFNRACMQGLISEQVNAFREFVEETARQELLCRQRLKADEPFVLVDLLNRTKALLQNAKLISADEALDTLSDLRLGVSLGVIRSPYSLLTLSPDWFIPFRDEIFFRESGEQMLRDGHVLPPEVRRFAPWRDDALRADSLRGFASFAICRELKERAARQ